MDPVTVGAVLLAALTGVSEAAGGRLWDRVVALVRRPLGGKRGRGGAGARWRGGAVAGEAELAALQQAPGDQERAVALARVLLGRAAADEEFGEQLQRWWRDAEPVRAALGNVVNTISGGSQQGPVLQGRDFTGIAFGSTPPPPAVPPDAPA
jgi:hypothetical protein